MTTSSGPGIALKQEAIGLAVMTELPLIIINVQRGGPSTGLPTKTEQADLLQAMLRPQRRMPGAGARGPQPRRLLRHRSGSVADRRALHDAGVPADRRLHRQRLRAVADSRCDEARRRSRSSIPARRPTASSFMPYARNERLARPWALPGTPGLMHRIGGLEKQDITGNVNYEPENHQHMVQLRAAKVAGIARDLPPQEVDGPQHGQTAGAELGRHVRRLRHGRPRVPGPTAARSPMLICGT